MRKNTSIPSLPPIPRSVLEDYRWADSHHTQLAKKYPEQWVAIVDKKVVSHGKRPDRVRAKAHQHINRPEIALHFVEGHIHLY
jgi:hypothetical protein